MRRRLITNNQSVLISNRLSSKETRPITTIPPLLKQIFAMANKFSSPSRL